MKISQLSDDERKEYLDKAYKAACDCFDDGELDQHPSHSVVDWMQRGRARDKAQDESNEGLGPRNIQRSSNGKQIKSGSDAEDPDMSEDAEDPDMSEDAEDPDMSEDDQQPKKSGPGGNSKPAMDGIFELGMDGVARFTTAKGQILVGDAAIVARAGQSNPGRVRRVANAIKGYDRLR